MTTREKVATLGQLLTGSKQARDGKGLLSWSGDLRIALIMVLLVVILCVLYIWQSVAILELTAQKENIQHTLTQTKEVNRLLEYEIGKAFSLHRISRIARNELGMIEPDQDEILYVHVNPTSNK